ncbi:MFS transporter [Azoarcus sp. DD4]|uniref:MFS transporter n=1 Tax=Azoarcus sp. DD4 TaxID=2027405 RepID=UPI00143D58A7|nr:MFS transporter [Azoarcus sp. DD4]
MSSAEPPDSWSPFAWAAAALCAGTMGTALASPLYPLYQAAWGFPASTITLIYVTYMFGVLATLLFLGRLPDHLGPMRVLKVGLVGIAVGLGISAFAPDVGWLLVGRAVIGVASGLTTTAGTAALVELEPAGPRRRAMMIASTICAVGFGLGPLAAGVIAQLFPAPLITCYLVVIALVAVVLVALGRGGQRSVAAAAQAPQGRLTLHPDFVLPERAAWPAFAVAGAAAFLAFALYSLYASLAPSFIGDMLPWHGTAVSGFAIALVLCISAATQVVLRGMPERRGMLLGLGILIASVGLLAVALRGRSALLFGVSDLIAGIGHGIAFMSAMGIVNRVTPVGKRAGLLSSFFTVGYLGTIVPVLGVGVLADHIGIPLAVTAFCAVFGVAALGLLLASRRVLRPAAV